MHRPPPARRLAITLLAAIGPSLSVARDCDAPIDAWQPRSAVQALAQRKGWQVERLKIDDGCYEIKGRDAEGRRIRAKLDPATLQVVDLKQGHGEHARERRRERDRPHGPAPAASPASTPAAGPIDPAGGTRPA